MLGQAEAAQDPGAPIPGAQGWPEATQGPGAPTSAHEAAHRWQRLPGP